jgi:hypothetical protein
MRSRLSQSGQALYFQRQKQLQAHKKSPKAGKQPALAGNNSTATIAAKIGEALGNKSGTCILNRVTAQRARRAQDALLQLQRQFGNRFIQRMVATSGTRRNSAGTEPNIGRNDSWKSGERIQRATDKSTDGSQYIELTIPDGPYVLEAANILAEADWRLTYTDYLDIYATASQYKPKKIKGLDANPHTLRHTDKGINVPGGEFRIKPGSDLTPKAGKGSAKVQAFRHGHLWDDRVIQAYLQFDTVPLLQSPGETKFIAGNVVDMDPKHHDYVNVAKGTRVGKEETSTISVSDGVTFSTSKSITNTIGGEITRQLGAEIGLEGIGKLSASSGVKLSLERSVTNAVGTSLSKKIQKTRQVKTTYQFEQPGNYAIVPTCKVWKTPIVVNTFDSSTGKVTGQKKGNLFTIIYNQTGSTAKVVGGKVDPRSVRTGSASGGGSE